MPKRVKFTMMLTTEELKALKALAEDEKLPMTIFMRRLINKCWYERPNKVKHLG